MRHHSRPRSFQQLREAAEQGTLSEAERAEWAASIQERCRAEEAAIAAAAQRTEETNADLAAQVQQVQAQNRELETMLQEQEAYLAEVQATVAAMEQRRRDWRERYQKLTGRALHEPVTAPPGG